MDRLSKLEAVWKDRIEYQKAGFPNGILRYTQPNPENLDQKPRRIGEKYTHWVEASFPSNYIRRRRSNGVWHQHVDNSTFLILTIENTCWIILEAYGDPKYPPNGREFAREFSSRNKGLSLYDANFLVYHIEKMDRYRARVAPQARSSGHTTVPAGYGSAAAFNSPNRAQNATENPSTTSLSFTFDGTMPFAEIYESLAPTRPKPPRAPAKPHVPDALERLRALKVVERKARDEAKAKAALAIDPSLGISGSTSSNSNTTSQEIRLGETPTAASVEPSPPQKLFPLTNTSATLSKSKTISQDTKVAEKTVATSVTTLPLRKLPLLSTSSIASSMLNSAAQKTEVTKKTVPDEDVLYLERMVRALPLEKQTQFFNRTSNLYTEFTHRRDQEDGNGNGRKRTASTQEMQLGAANPKRKRDPSLEEVSSETYQSSIRASEAHGSKGDPSEVKRRKAARLSEQDSSSPITQNLQSLQLRPLPKTAPRPATPPTVMTRGHDPEASSLHLSFEEVYNDPLFWSNGIFVGFTPEERRHMNSCV